MKKVCYICGREIKSGMMYYSMGDNTYVCHSDRCIKTSFWDRIKANVAGDTRHEYAIIDSSIYQIGHDDDNPRGCSGKHYIIRFNDGTIRHTNSLWYISWVPWPQHKWLKDNAQFIYDAGE